MLLNIVTNPKVKCKTPNIFCRPVHSSKIGYNQCELLHNIINCQIDDFKFNMVFPFSFYFHFCDSPRDLHYLKEKKNRNSNILDLMEPSNKRLRTAEPETSVEMDEDERLLQELGDIVNNTGKIAYFKPLFDWTYLEIKSRLICADPIFPETFGYNSTYNIAYIRIQDEYYLQITKFIEETTKAFQFINIDDLPASEKVIAAVKGDNVIFIRNTETNFAIEKIKSSIFNRAFATLNNKIKAEEIAGAVENIKLVVEKKITVVWFNPDLDPRLIDSLNNQLILNNMLHSFGTVINTTQFRVDLKLPVTLLKNNVQVKDCLCRVFKVDAKSIRGNPTRGKVTIYLYDNHDKELLINQKRFTSLNFVVPSEKVLSLKFELLLIFQAIGGRETILPINEKINGSTINKYFFDNFVTIISHSSCSIPLILDQINIKLFRNSRKSVKKNSIYPDKKLYRFKLNSIFKIRTRLTNTHFSSLELYEIQHIVNELTYKKKTHGVLHKVQGITLESFLIFLCLLNRYRKMKILIKISLIIIMSSIVLTNIIINIGIIAVYSILSCPPNKWIHLLASCVKGVLAEKYLEYISINVGSSILNPNNINNIRDTIINTSPTAILVQEACIYEEDFKWVECQLRDLNYSVYGISSKRHTTINKNIKKKAKDIAENNNISEKQAENFSLGVKTSINKSLCFIIKNDVKIIQRGYDKIFGRFQYIIIECNTQKSIILWNIYGFPSDGKKKANFFNNLKKEIIKVENSIKNSYPQTYSIIGGDTNVKYNFEPFEDLCNFFGIQDLDEINNHGKYTYTKGMLRQK